MTINPLRSRPSVEIGERPKPTKAQKVAAWNEANGICWLCGKPVAPDGLDVEWDHEIPRALTGDDAEVKPVHVRCHARKTATADIPRIAKAKRQEKLTRPKVRKRSGFNAWRKFDGTPVRRGQS